MSSVYSYYSTVCKGLRLEKLKMSINRRLVKAIMGIHKMEYSATFEKNVVVLFTNTNMGQSTRLQS